MEKQIEKAPKKKPFSFLEHNRKIAKLRGSKWKEKLRLAKIRDATFLSPLVVARNEKGLSQRDMIPLLGVNNNTIYARIERGDKPTNRARAEKIAEILGKPVTDLFIEYDKDKFVAI